MTAPERIWADPPTIFDEMDCWHSDPHETRTEYIRADLARPTLTHALELPEVAALVEACCAWGMHIEPDEITADDPFREIRAALSALTTAPVDRDKK